MLLWKKKKGLGEEEKEEVQSTEVGCKNCCGLVIKQRNIFTGCLIARFVFYVSVTFLALEHIEGVPGSV